MKVSPIVDAPQMIIQNAAGHLFLTGDGNGCHEQHLGERLIDAETVDRWHSHLQSFKSLQSERGFEFLFLPAPDKQSIYWETLAEKPDHRNIARLLERCDPKHWVDPLDRLRALARNSMSDPFPMIDSHWNSLGALEALELVLARWGLRVDSAEIESQLIDQRIEGDLGVKTSPRTSGVARNLNPAHWRKLLIYDSGIPDNGRIRLFANEAAPVGGRLLIVGDSFSYRLTELASQVFREVFQFHGHFVDRNFWRVIQPDYVIFEQAERFFIRPPRHSLESSFSRLIEEKVDANVDLHATMDRFRNLRSRRVLSLHQSLTVAMAERSLQALGLIESPFQVDGLSTALRVVRESL